MLNEIGFDLWADGYDASVRISDADSTYPFAGYREVLERIYDRIRRGCGNRVMDIGFGTAILTGRLYADGYQITGVDFSTQMMLIAQQKMPSAHLIYHDFSQGLPDELAGFLFDAIVCTYAIHHLTAEQKITFLRQLEQHLTPGGQILIGDIAFQTRAEHDACRLRSGDEWDDEESYLVFDELLSQFPTARYEQVSHCAGILTLTNHIV